MPLKLYSTLAREKQRFEPLNREHVRMYVCGPTVYDDIHIGNARPIVVFDVLYRLLKQSYPRVTYVRNITDVDDKINARAEERGVDIRALTEETARRFHADIEKLGVLVPDVEPRATEHIPQMIALIERLIENGNAYEADGHVLFHVPSWPDYGGLSRRSRDDLVAGARVEVAPYKRDPADFVLWKPSSPELPGWDSPWGRGRPGWHIECSAMSAEYLGQDFDIHGGGVDLVFPHHENEIAQSVCGHPGTRFARYWVHNGYLLSEGEKMSKSLGNFYTLHDLLRDFPGEALRLTLLATHYRQPLDFTRAAVTTARRQLDRIYRPLCEAKEVAPSTDQPPPAFLSALDDDINTPLALRFLREAAHCLSRALKNGDAVAMAQHKGELLAGVELLGLSQDDPEAWFKGAVDDGQIGELIEARAAARECKDFAEADRIRTLLEEMGIVLEDCTDGTTKWRRAG